MGAGGPRGNSLASGGFSDLVFVLRNEQDGRIDGCFQKARYSTLGSKAGKMGRREEPLGVAMVAEAEQR